MLGVKLNLTDKENADMNLFRKFLEKPQWYVYPTLVVSFISISILVVVIAIKTYSIINRIITEKNITGIDSSYISSELFSVIDMVLLIILFYIMSLAIYRFFIGSVDSRGWLNLHTLTDFKIIITKTTIMFLATFIVHKIVEWKEPIETLYFTISVVTICTILIWYIIVLRKYFDNNNPN